MTAQQLAAAPHKRHAGRKATGHILVGGLRGLATAVPSAFPAGRGGPWRVQGGGHLRRSAWRVMPAIDHHIVEIVAAPLFVTSGGRGALT
jgi:hypothetical protein